MSKPDILVVNKSLPKVLEGLGEDFLIHSYWMVENKEQFLDEIVDKVRAIVVGGGLDINAELLDRCTNLELVANFGVGYDGIDANHAAKNGVIVTNTPDVLSDEVADTAIGLMIMAVREFGAAERWLRAGKWSNQGPYPLTKGTLRGKSLGILGLGRIGRAIAKRAESFGMTIAYHGRSKQSGIGYRYFANLVELASNSDILISVVPGGKETQHIVNDKVFAALGNDGVFVNVGRGSSVDEKAMVNALQNGTIHAVGLDVFENEPEVPQSLIDHERAVLLPHVGSASAFTRDAMGQLVVDNIRNWFENGSPVTPVVETPWPR